MTSGPQYDTKNSSAKYISDMSKRKDAFSDIVVDITKYGHSGNTSF